MSAMGLLDSLKGLLELDTEETVLYELTCDECEAEFMTPTPPSEATCEDCGGVERHGTKPALRWRRGSGWCVRRPARLPTRKPLGPIQGPISGDSFVLRHP